MRMIYADEAKEKMKYMAAYSTHGCLLYLSDVLHKIDECQTLNISGEETGWIPVTERLPGNYETVLVWIAESRIYDVAIYDTINGFRPWYSGYYEDCPEEWRDPVTAWMPLPKPYKETNK